MNAERIDKALDGVYQRFASLDAKAAADFMEAIIERVYRTWLRDGALAVDMGACVGRHTAPMAEAVGTAGRVVAFEPVPSSARTLRKNLAARDVLTRVDVHECALSNTSGTAEFFVAEQLVGWSGLRQRPRYGRETSVRPIETPVHTLDELLRTRERAVAFIKADLEGGELHALQGARDILTHDRPIVVLEADIKSAARMYGFETEEYFGYFDSVRYGLKDVFGCPMFRRNVAKRYPWYLVAYPLERDSETSKVLAVALVGEMLRRFIGGDGS
ncbi:MAG: FkbM family methyltransferase [Planctomycetes bacterium]|nr:FkbM family methyltransferase [Planctomycetota bacterium]